MKKTTKKSSSSMSYYNLIIGLAGPYGSGCSSLAEEVEKIGSNWPGCHVEKISVSKLIEEHYEEFTGKSLGPVEEETPERRKKLQNAGTDIRIATKDIEIIGKIIVLEINTKAKKFEEDNKLNKTGTLIFVIDSLKNVGDLNLLRRVFASEFFFCFVHANKDARWRRMRDYKSWKEGDKKKFQERDDIDNNEKKVRPITKDFGQQVGKLASHSDYYIVNNTNREALKNDCHRFTRLLLGEEISQPTFNERNMHLAFSAENSSACLSRQVGAAIFTPDGNVLAVGHNDVPKSGGGLYSVESDTDSRCFKVGDRRCINDTNKEERFKSLEEDIYKELKVEESKEKKKISRLVEASDFKEATEYCRAVHAEMAAILSVSRNLSGSTIGATMYVTTQPCHNCTKHIICAGIKKVVYIEPYPKSLGEELHSDAIMLDPQNTLCSKEKVLFIPYQGVAPHRYHDFFKMTEERKDEKGRMKQVTKIQWSNSPKFAQKLSKRLRLSDEAITNPKTIAEMLILEDLKNNYLPKLEEGDDK